MSNANLSTAATSVISAYGITATNVINSTRFGGERLVEFVDSQFAQVVNRGASALRQGLRSSLIESQQRVSGYCVKGVHFGTERAQNVVGTAVDLATKGVSLVASNAARIDRAANLNALGTLNRVALPAVQFAVLVAERIEEGSSDLVRRVAGKPVPAKAVATRKLRSTTSKAAATRKRVTKAVTETANEQVQNVAAARKRVTQAAEQQVKKAVATRKRVTKTATREVSQAVADTATQASNAARRVARKARATAKSA